MRKITFIVLLALLAMAPFASAQAPRSYGDRDDGYYDRNGQWHPYDDDDDDDRSDARGYYDRNGQWHWYDDQQQQQQGGYYDRNGQWHPSDTRSGGYYDRNGQWHPYDSRSGNSRVGRAAAPSRWTWSDNRGRSESLSTAARNLALTASAVNREASRRSGFDDRAALEALRRLEERAQYFARAAQQGNRGTVVGSAYADLVDAFLFVEQRFGALRPDARLANTFRVLSAAMGRLDKRYFGSRVFGGQNPANMGYRYDGGYDSYYDEYGNPLPRSGRDTRPYQY